MEKEVFEAKLQQKERGAPFVSVFNPFWVRVYLAFWEPLFFLAP